MNPDSEFESVEMELRQVKPAEPNPRLQRRLESAVSYPPLAGTPDPEAVHNVVRPPRSLWANPWFHTAAAALIGAAAVLIFNSFGPEPNEVVEMPEPPSTGGTPIEPSFPRSLNPEGFRLAGTEDRVFNSHDDGIVFSKDEIPFRRVRYDTMVRRVFQDPETGAIFELLVPREDILIVPAETF